MSDAIMIHQVIDEVRKELNPDGGGYDSDEAVDLVYSRLKPHLCDGHIPLAAEQLVRLGIRAELDDIEDMEAGP
jgi:hypothetical protein